MPITVKHKFVSAIPDAGDPTIVQPSNWNDTHELTGLGTMAEQDANNVAITGGTISGVTLPASNITGTLGVPNGGTGATTLTGYVKGTGTTPMTAAATIPNTDITGLGTASTKDAGAANGVATLDAGGKVPISELPAAVLGALSYQGTWDASTNTPTLVSSVGSKGYYYVVSVAGNTNLNGITDWLVGDWAVFNGSIWQKVDNTETVTSVNGQIGAVVLTTTDIAEGTNLYYTDVRARASNSAGTGISYDSATGVITNAAPDQTVVLTDGTAIDVTGTYPNFTINNTAPDQIVALTGAGTTTISGTYPNFTVTSNDAFVGTVTSVAATAGTGISVTGSPITTSGTLNITNTAPDQIVSLTQGGTTTITGTYPNFTITSDDQFDGTVTSVNLTAGTGMSVSGGPITSSGSITVTNTAPDQVVSLTGAGTTSISGTYPNFTITSNDSKVGDVVGPASATDNAVARYDTTTGKLIQNSVVIIDDTGSVTGVNALTAESLTVNNNATLGLSNTDTLDVNARITTDLDPNVNNAKDIGSSGRNWRDGFFGRTVHTVNLEVTGTTSFDGSQGTIGQILTSQGTGNTPIWTTGGTGTVTSITAGTGLTGGTITTSGTIAIDSTVVTTTGSYANPSWITSLDGSKITGTLDGGSF